MEQRNFQILKREFRCVGQGYTLVKIMVFMYALKKSNIEYPLYSEKEKSAQDYLNKTFILVKQNLIKIEETCGKEFIEVLNYCIKDFDRYVSSKSLLGEALLILNELTTEDIADFIINDATYAGERDDFSSPKNLMNLVIGLLNNKENQSWFDLGCGNGDFLIELAKRNKNFTCYGEDINTNCQLLSKIRLYFAGAKADIKGRNILLSQYDEIADVAYANTPFMMRLSKGELDYNSFNKFVGTLKPSQNADWIFADRLLQCIKDRGIILMTEASLMNINDIEQRKNVIEQNYVEGIIRLPANLFIYTGISVSIVIFNKNKTNKEIKFLDATKMCNIGRRLSELKFEEILEAYNSEICVIKVDYDSVSKDDYSLNVKRYLDVNDITLENETILETVVEEIFRGVQIPASTIDENAMVEEGEEVYKLISVGDMQNGSFDIDSLQVIKNDGKYDRYLVKNGDVLVSSKSTKIKTAIVENPDNQKLVATGSILVIRCDQEKINPIYLKSFFDSNNGSKLLESIQTGTVIMSINASALMKMRISLVDRSIQDEIAEKFLLKLDQFKVTQAKLAKLEKELNNVFDESIGG